MTPEYRIEFDPPDIAAIPQRRRHGLVQPTARIAARLGRPNEFTLEGDTLEVVQALAPEVAPLLTDEQLPTVAGVRHGSGYTVTARLPGLLRSGDGPGAVVDLSYAITWPQRRAGGSLSRFGSRVTALSVTLFNAKSREEPEIIGGLAVYCAINGLWCLLQGSLSERVYWRTE